MRRKTRHFIMPLDIHMQRLSDNFCLHRNICIFSDGPRAGGTGCGSGFAGKRWDDSSPLCLQVHPSELCWALTQKQKNWSRDTFNHFLTRTIWEIRFKISIPKRKGKLSRWINNRAIITYMDFFAELTMCCCRHIKASQYSNSNWTQCNLLRKHQDDVWARKLMQKPQIREKHNREVWGGCHVRENGLRGWRPGLGYGSAACGGEKGVHHQGERWKRLTDYNSAAMSN